jgi:hypothetical protein
LFGVGFELEEHDSITELGVAGDDASANNDGVTIKPENSLNSDPDRKRNEELDVTPIAAEVSGFQAHREVVAFLAKFDLNPDGVTRIASPLRVRERRSGWLLIGEIHGGSGRASDGGAGPV